MGAEAAAPPSSVNERPAVHSITSSARASSISGTLRPVAFAVPLAARAQQGERMRRIGVLMNLAADDPESSTRVAAFAQGLGELGWNVGRNVRIDYRWGAGDVGSVRRYAVEMAEGWFRSFTTAVN
jgi:hypothetical protein